MQRDFGAVLVTAVFLLVTAGCQEAAPPVGGLTVSPSSVGLDFPGLSQVDLSLEMDADLDSQGPLWVMVHLLDSDGVVVRTFDHPLPEPWKAGGSQQHSVALYQSALSPPLDEGNYRLTVGLFDSAQRFPLRTEALEVHRNEYQVATVAVAPTNQDRPKFFFSPSWLATEAGTDVQILGRRWLRGEGSLRVGNLRQPGSLRVSLRIPEPDPDVEELVRNEGYESVVLDVASDCSDASWTFTGLGVHAFDAALPGSDATCELTFTPHYQIVTRRNLDSRAFALELLSWTQIP